MHTWQLNEPALWGSNVLFLFVSRAKLQPLVLVHPGRAAIFIVTSALHTGK